MLALIEKHLQHIREARNDADILTLLRQIADQFGFRSAYIIEYVGEYKYAEHIIDTDSRRTGWWNEYFNGPWHDRPSIDRVLTSAPVISLNASRFSSTADPLYEFSRRNDMVDCTIVPITHAGIVVGAAGYSGNKHLTASDQTALQLVSYSLFSQTRSFRNVGIKTAAVGLTAREKEVMLLSAEGLTSQEIANNLGMSPRTVNQHVDNVADKLGTKNRTHTVAEAIRHDLLK